MRGRLYVAVGGIVLPLEWLPTLGESEDGVGRGEGRHLRLCVDEALRGVTVLMVPPQRMQLVVAKL